MRHTIFLAACLNALVSEGHAETPSAGAGRDPAAEAHRLAALPPALPPHGHRSAIDPSGRKQAGEVSVYAKHFQGRRMADGARFSHASNAAASKTLPIGTVAKVTNLQTGRTAEVVVKDHGPFLDGRTMDVSRATARNLGISPKDGVAPVVVAPVVVPQPDGGVKVGAGAVPGPATAR
jgi:rare lipoprotein A